MNATEHARTPMEFVGHDYVTQRLNGKRCHHKAIFVCQLCQSEKRYFLNLMPRNKKPFCNGLLQKLATIIGMLLVASATAQAQSYDAWENYYGQYGNYFDRFFNKPRIMAYGYDRQAHKATVRMMRQFGSLRQVGK